MEEDIILFLPLVIITFVPTFVPAFVPDLPIPDGRAITLPQTECELRPPKILILTGLACNTKEEALEDCRQLREECQKHDPAAWKRVWHTRDFAKKIVI